MEAIDYIKEKKEITKNIGKLVQELILSGKCDEFDGSGYNTYIENVEYAPGLDVLFVQVFQQEDYLFNIHVYAQSKDETMSVFAPFEELGADAAIEVYNQVKAHSDDLKRIMIDYIKKDLEKADINTLTKLFNTLF